MHGTGVIGQCYVGVQWHVVLTVLTTDHEADREVEDSLFDHFFKGIFNNSEFST